MIEEDAELMLAFKRGDYNAFSILVERYQRPLIRFFFAQSLDRALAEDCAQEVWRKIFRARSDYSPRALFKTYLFRVARNHWIDVYRSNAKTAGTVSLDASGDERTGRALTGAVAGDAPTPMIELSRRELRERLETAMSQLTDAHREVFVLAELQGLRYAEIGEILGIPIGTVKSRMFNAVRRLRELLGRDGTDES